MFKLIFNEVFKIMKLFLLTIIFVFFFQPLTRADIMQYNDVPPSTLPDDVIPVYCLTTYETLQDDVVYLCKKVSIIPVPQFSVPEYSPQAYGRAHCWEMSYGSWSNGYGISQNMGTGITLSQVHEYYGLTPPAFDPTKVCVKKSEISPEACDLNIRSIVNGAFSNKFPLDLFTNFVSQAMPNACPSFTIEGQTFQLCYINSLARSLKYVLLIVFIISSVVAL